MENIGVNLGSSISKNTDYVIVKDLEEITTKVEKAKQLNIPIKTIQEIQKLM